MIRKIDRQVLREFQAAFGGVAITASDGQLLERFVRTGEEGAFAALFKRHGPMVLHVCRRLLVEQHDAEDAFQATFLLLVKKASSIRKGEAVASWLYGTAYRTAALLRRQAARRTECEKKAQVAPVREPGYEAAWRELQEVIDEEIAALPPKYRAALVLCCLEGKSFEEAGRQLGWPVGTVHSRVARAREALRRRLNARGLAVPAALIAAALAVRTLSAVPAALAKDTLAVALHVAAGSPTAALVSSQAAALVERTVNKMLLAKISAGLLLIASAGAALAYFAAGGPGAPTGPTRPVAVPAAPAKPADAPRATTDLSGDALPEGAASRLGTRRLFSGAFGQPAFTPDAKAVVTSDTDGALRFWDVASGAELRRLDPVPVRPQRLGAAVPGHIAFTADGKYVLTAHAKAEIYVRDAETGKVVRKFETEQPFATYRYFALSPDGKWLAVSGANDSHKVVIHDVATGKQLPAFVAGEEGSVATTPRCAAFSPDGKHAAVGTSDGAVRVWDVATGKEALKFDAHRSEVAALAFSPDARSLATISPDGSVRVWDAATGEQKRGWSPRALGRRFSPNDLSFADGGRRLVLSGHGVARAWVVESGEEVPLRGPESLADVDPAPPPDAGLDGPGTSVAVLQALSPDGKVLATAQPGLRLRLHNAATGAELHNHAGHEGAVASVAISAAGMVATGGNDRTVRVWDGASGRERWVGRGHVGPVGFVVFSPDGKRLASASSTDRVVSLWDVATGKELHQYRWAGFIQGLAFLDGGRLLTARGPDVVWDVESGKVVRQNKDQRAIFPALTPDGRLQAALRMVADPGTEGKANRHVVITDPVTGKEVVSFPAQRPGREEDPNTYIMALAPAQDARAVLARYSGPEPYFALFNTATGQARRMQVRLNAERPSGRQNAATGLPFFLSDGRQVVYVEPPGKVHILEVASGLDRRTIEPRQGGVTALAASPDGRLLATGGSDGTAVVWNVSPAAGAARTAPTEAELEALWGDLLGDAPKAVNAIGVLGSAPEKAVPFLAGKVRPAPKPDLERIGRLIKDLDAGGTPAVEPAQL